MKQGGLNTDTGVYIAPPATASAHAAGAGVERPIVCVSGAGAGGQPAYGDGVPPPYGAPNEMAVKQSAM